ncbi:MAG TPA: PEGA domain-containing protein [Calditrichia bacterium]|nr:PEGA domain-containing protein [Calditrichota bacterium]HQU72528.1 PEGA domain-containing protein [Calditrichia bacterium]HQV32435.1 PEGA domain-containing protein [Calditrichia bacterium]
MALTPEEEKKLREQIRENLQDREKRMVDNKEKAREGRQRGLEERLRRQIREEEEERYFSERGYVKHTNRYGEVEWLHPEEKEMRVNRRRSSKGNRKKSRRKRRIYLQWAINAGILIVAAGLFWFLLNYNPDAAGAQVGSLTVETDVPGARVFVNGDEDAGIFTPDTLLNLKPGNYYVSVFKDGYTSWPPMQRTTIKANDRQTLRFELKNAGRLGTLSVSSNETEFQLFVNGLPVRTDHLENLSVPAGYHVVSAVKAGYAVEPANQRVLIREEGVTRVSFTFRPSPEMGMLEVTSNRSNAYIFLDNYLTGIKANTGPVPVKPGLYEVRLSENGYESFPAVELLEIEAGQGYRLAFNMSPETLSDTLSLITSTPGAMIIHNGVILPYVTPVENYLVSEGTHYFNFIRAESLYAANEIRLDVNQLNEKVLSVDF